MLSIKNEKHRYILALLIVLFVVFIYQATKKDDPHTVNLACKRLQTEKINGSIIRISNSKDETYFAAEIYNSDKRIKYTVDQWMIDSPSQHLKIGDSIIKKEDSKDYLIFRTVNDSLIMMELHGDCKNVKLNN